MAVAVITNPRSRANRRDPGLRDRLAATLGREGDLLAPESLEALDQVARDLAARPPTIVAVHGGDGTLHRAISALAAAFRDAPLPPLGILPGGTMNVVASSLGLRADPEWLARRLVANGRTATQVATLPTIRRRCLKVAATPRAQFGFVFGSGFMANFLEEYYEKPGYGARRAAWVLLRTFVSAAVDGPYARQICATFDGTVRVDGRALGRRPFTGVGAATVREVGLGFKLNHRADDDPERFSVVGIFAQPLPLALDLWAVHRGRGVSPKRAESAVASSLVIEPAAASGETLYTIDGDLYRARGRLEIGVGPALHFVKAG